ncbi:hypothetical protein HHI36_021935 [Cryptolaemus montrouzieri]|uniref:PiggyBac transposable element-derived protein domain-containing protein n=1 Tax=Cryptolaemus montrouzieri TaxID=559131 RepID=A0ABD2MYK8_9CUCU
MSHQANRNICSTGTIRQNRLEGCPFPEKNVWNREKRESFQFLSNEKILMAQWKDNKLVTMATNLENQSMMTARRCKEDKSKQNVPQPKVVSNYNKCMEGVDKMDGLVAAYRSRMRQRKWYWPIFHYFFDVRVVNGWILMKKLRPEDPNSRPQR